MKPNLQLGEMVHFVLRPIQRGIITAIEYYLDGSYFYKISFFDEEGHAVSGYFFEQEIEGEE